MPESAPPPRTAWELAKSVVWAQRRRLALGLVLLFVDRAAGFVVPLAPKWLIDDVIGQRRVELLPWIAAAVVGAAVVQAGAVFALSRVLGLSAELVVLRWRRRVMARVTRLPLAHLDHTQSGALASRILDDATSLQNLVGWNVARWASNVVTAVAALGVLVWLDWRITLAALAFAAVPGLAFDVAHRKLRPLFALRSRVRADVQGRLTQTLGGLRVVKAYGAEKREQIVFTRGLHRLYRVLARSVMRKSAMNALAVLVVACVVAMVIVLGAQAILGGRMTLGQFGTYVAFAITFSAPLLDLPEIATRIVETLADLDRVRDLEALAPEDAADATRAALGRIRGDVAFDDVAFAYDPGVSVLRGVSFMARAGTTTAIVGASGAGKTTMLALLMGFYRPTRGTISVDGRDLTTIRVRDWRRSLGVVLQDDFLFDGTIAENIAFARPRATREEVALASRAAHCDEFVRGFPQGLDTVVGERGVKLSGGQRQRVAIARAFLADAPIVLLDEATSSLDSESETVVRDALATLRSGRTTFVIAHRLSTIQAADQILVLDGGEIVARGTHRHLLGTSGRYRALYEAQFGRHPEGFAAIGDRA
jgi:subfamily B ATP-binding cassette protein MsbA